MKIDGRLSIVGGFKKEGDEEVKYIWLPAGLSRNFTESKVTQLKSAIENGKKGYILYKGLKSTVYGTVAYDVCWVPKKK